MNELYADVFAQCYGVETIGLRYFNVFGARQDPEGPYAAVIPCWIRAMLAAQPVQINGDGETTRDFCYVSNAVQANLLAATTATPGVDEPGLQHRGGRPHVAQPTIPHAAGAARPCGVACGARCSPTTGTSVPATCVTRKPTYRKRSGCSGTSPTHDVRSGLEEALGVVCTRVRT